MIYLTDMWYIASDHVGIYLKKDLISFLKKKGIQLHDLGTETDDRVDYPLFAKRLCLAVKRDSNNKGILVCGTGLGMSMMANRFKGIRAAVCTNEYMAEMAVRHNNANVLCLGARILTTPVAKSILKKFMESSFEGGRYFKRITLLDK